MTNIAPFTVISNEGNGEVTTIAKRICDELIGGLSQLPEEFPSMTGCLVFAFDDRGGFKMAWQNDSAIPSIALPSFVHNAILKILSEATEECDQ